ncbi:3'-5' RNA helicase YTHDC2-like [Amphiura filiformis]|uniref:3'-5' RNA helicase YTHDC2-like n=1 Tax=Amphiura filiformis TaxID=82378 RepID=UPI003B21059F
MAGRKGRGKKNDYEICVGEDFKISINAAIKEFRHDESKREIEFPPSFTSTQRAFVHRLAQSMGLNSKSKGKGINRYLTLSKKATTMLGSMATFTMTPASCSESYTMLQRFPLNVKERQELQPRQERRRYTGPGSQPREIPKTTGRLNNGLPQVPNKRSPSDLETFRATLPVYDMQRDILTAIGGNRVLLICGETGSGKTTQVPQFILDEAHQLSRPCRIICTQPRRLSALSVAERVAAERGESIGQTVGYQIRLESRVSPKTLLTFCTNGVLLRTLMSGEHALSTITHVIVDEIHERDRFSDFLVIQLRDILSRHKHLKVILMSAALDTELFVRYFNSCPVVSVPGKLFDVEELFLEDALKCTGYTNKKMVEYKKEKVKVVQQQVQLDQWLQNETKELDGAKASTESNALDQLSHAAANMSMGASAQPVLDNSIDVRDMPDWLQKDMDSTLTNCWLTGSDEAFAQLMVLVLNENVSVDYAHSDTSATPLTIAAGRGKVEVMERLLSLGANVNARMSNDMTALDMARKFQQTEAVELLEAHIAAIQSNPTDDADLVKQHSNEISEEDKELLQAYHHSFDDERVDLDLVLALLTYICDNSQEGAILVFLPGYDDIVTLRDKLLNDERKFSDSNTYRIYTLHSAMQSSDQKKVFQTTPRGSRKVILSTNIAETSVTINDVVFVIDSGKVKEKTFDALASISMLKSTWISKASAKQRKGRAGRCRPGMCFHMMSRIRFNSLPPFQTPEILRVPLQELCLHSKLLAPPDSPIADFLAKAPDPPAFLVVRNAVQLLKAIDCMDQWEDLTELGQHLADLPVEPRLGKMVLYSIVLKCLDPVLTIVCGLAYRDPFILPNHPSQKRVSLGVRKKYSSNTFSDHMALLRAFQAWQRARSDGWEKVFCQRNFLSQATLEMIVGMRTQLLGQLRASGFVRARGPGDIRDLNTNSENWAVVKAAMCAGMYPNIIKVDRNRNQLTTQTEKKVRFHPNSVMHENATNKLTVGENHFQTVQSLPTDWLLYEEMTRSNHYTSVRCVTVITPITVALFAGPSRLALDALTQPSNPTMVFKDKDSSSEEEEEEMTQKAILKLDEWLVLKADPAIASIALQLRQKWHTLFLRRMRTPAKPWSQADEGVLNAILKVLSNEEQAVGLQQPVGVGQRPRPVAVEHFNSPPRSNIGGRFSQQNQQSVQFSNSRMNGPGASPGNKNRSPQGHQQFYQPANRSPSGGWTSGGQRSSPGRGRANFSPGSVNQQGFNQPRPGSVGAQGGGGSRSTDSCRYFILKCSDPRNIEMSYNQGVWCTTPGNEKILGQAFKTVSNVFLVITLQGSGQFQGYAKMNSDICYPRSAEWRDNSGRLGGEFGVQWIKKANVSFHQTRHLLNPWNGNQRIQASRDGQELEPSIGDKVTQLWFRAPTCPVNNGGAGDFASNQLPAAAAITSSSGVQWSQRSEVTPPSSPKPQPQKLDSPSMQWPTEGIFHPLAHSSPAYLQGPGSMFGQGQKSNTSSNSELDYGPSGAMYFPGGDSGQMMPSVRRHWSGGYEAAGQTKSIADSW